MPATPVVFVGLGPIGRSTLAHALARENLRIVGACDAAPALAGKRIADLVSGSPPKVRVSPSVAKLARAPAGAVAIVCTSSHVEEAAATFEALVAKGYHVVSSCEELVFPHRLHAAFARRIDALAKRRKVAVLGTGVNPGYVLDLLPALLSGPCLTVKAIRARRVVDARTRRGPLQKKVGAGKTVAEFRREAAAGTLGHVGLRESADLLAAALGFGEMQIHETLEPVLANDSLDTPFVHVDPGQVAGIDHHLVARTSEHTIDLHLRMFLDAPDPIDEIEVDGEPPMHLRLAGGTAGDLATVAALLNAAPGMSRAEPGLRTVLDGPFPLCRASAASTASPSAGARRAARRATARSARGS